VSPGAVFSSITIHGDGVTDDKAGIQAAMVAGNIYVTAATYAIAGTMTVPTGTQIKCNPGAIFLDTQSQTTRMFKIGGGDGAVPFPSNGNNSIVGCTFKGTDTADNYSTYVSSGGGYSDLLEISSGWGNHTDNVLIENNTFLDGQGDHIVTFSPCGTASTGVQCNNGTPGTEGPSNIFIVNNTVSHCEQPGIHLNGGQNLVVAGNTVTDCNAYNEVDSGILQVISSWWHDNTFTTVLGKNGGIYGGQPVHSCDGNITIAQDSSRCYAYNELITGSTSFGPAILAEPTPPCTGGIKPGHYINESVTNGAVVDTGC
jgi:parallel beta-helix repeat protein